MIIGEKVSVRAIEKEDLKTLMDWRNLPEFRKHFREYRELGWDMQENWYKTKVVDDPSTIMFSIVDTKTEELLGCCGLCYINWIHRNADLSLYIGWRKAYIDDKGFAEESCKLLFNYAFNELNLHKIWTEIYEFDLKKYKLYRKLGLKEDGKLRAQYYYGGKWWDSYILSILKQDFK